LNDGRLRRLRAGVDLAAKHLRSIGNDGISARALGDAVNAAFADEPATTKWYVTRAELDSSLARDPRFCLRSDLWYLASDTSTEAIESARALVIDPLRLGVALTLHDWQREAIAAWKFAGRRGIIEAVTGSGKTRVGIAAVAEHLCSPSARAVILVPTIELANQWLRSLHADFTVPVAIVGDGSTADFETNSVLVYVARSASDDLPPRMRRLATSRPVLLVADECHRYGSETFARALDAPFAATMGLSATPEREHDEGMEQFVVPRLGEVVYAYDHDRGIGDAVISDFRICFVGVDFAIPERDEHDQLSLQLERSHRTLLAEFPFLENARPFILAVKTLAARDEEGAARSYLRIAGERRRLLNGASSRHAVVLWLAEQGALTGNRTLLFHETIADCEHLAQGLIGAGVAAAAHHSELGRESRRSTLNSFARGELSAIAAPRTLDEGIDVPDASLAIIVAGRSVKRQTIQRIGRVLRRAPDKRTAKVIKVFVNDAADDPTLPSAPRFARELAASPRGLVRRWPSEAPDILNFLRDFG